MHTSLRHLRSNRNNGKGLVYAIAPFAYGSGRLGLDVSDWKCSNVVTVSCWTVPHGSAVLRPGHILYIYTSIYVSVSHTEAPLLSTERSLRVTHTHAEEQQMHMQVPCIIVLTIV